MLDELGSAPEHASRTVTADRSKHSLLGRFATQFSDSPVSFEIILPDGTVQPFGPASASFSLILKNKRALRAIASIDEGRSRSVSCYRMILRHPN
jgi:hypothetical protein